MARRKCPLCKGPSDESAGGWLTCRDDSCPMSSEWMLPETWEGIRKKIQQARYNEHRWWKRQLRKLKPTYYPDSDSGGENAYPQRAVDELFEMSDEVRRG